MTDTLCLFSLSSLTLHQPFRRASAATYEYKGTKYPPVSASATKVNDKAEVSKELTIEEIQEIVKAFGNASKLAIEAGFDGIEIHGANG